MLLPPREHRDLADAAEVAGEEAADRSRADYADALDTTLRSCCTPCVASSYGSSRQSDPSSSASEKISRSKKPSQRSASRIGPKSTTPSPGRTRSLVLRVGSRQSARLPPTCGYPPTPTVMIADARDVTGRTELSVGDSKETMAFAKKGGYVGITLEAIRRSDIQRLQAIPRELVKSAIRTRSAASDATRACRSSAGV